jgi:hypothetical protein
MNRHSWKIASFALLLLLGVSRPALAGYTDLSSAWIPTPPPLASPLVDPSVTGTWSTNDPTEVRRLFRDGNPSVYYIQKAFPGTSLEPARYATYSGSTLTNPLSTPAGLFVSLSDPLNGTFVSAYLGAFNPNNLAQNYLGDAGLSGDGTSFSVLVPVGGSVTLVANTVGGLTASLGKSYTISYFFSPVPEPSSIVLLVSGLIGVAGHQARRHCRPRA